MKANEITWMCPECGRELHKGERCPECNRRAEGRDLYAETIWQQEHRPIDGLFRR